MKNQFSFYWSCFLEICNILAILAVLIVLGKTRNTEISLLASIEIIQLCDLFVKYFLKKTDSMIKFIEIKEMNRKGSLLKFLYSFPQVILLQILKTNINEFNVDEEIAILFLSVKLLGLFDLFQFLSYFKQYLMATNIKNLFVIKIIENLIIVIFSHHIFSCIWLIFYKYHPENSKK